MKFSYLFAFANLSLAFAEGIRSINDFTNFSLVPVEIRVNGRLWNSSDTSYAAKTTTDSNSTNQTAEPTTSGPLIRKVTKNGSCSSLERKVKVAIKSDNHGDDTTWEIVDAKGNALVKSTKVYGKLETDTREFCLRKGSSYEFVLYDKWGDGMCCSQGEGYFKVSLFDNGTWKEVFSGGSFRTKELRQKINLIQPKMVQRDTDWLNSHNSRRKKWHTENGKSYVPLKWSNALKADANKWAVKLLDDCGKGMWHDPENSSYGENVAGNSGNGSWGTIRTTEDILTRFVEREEDDEYPHNGHLTQVLWRPSKYVGCAEASKPYGNGDGMCHTQVCRYARTGNCNMGSYKVAGNDKWWLKPMLMDESSCGPQCPPDGCY